ncbi:MAG: LysR family transcriptional regulator [Pseudomonadota bacterium]
MRINYDLSDLQAFLAVKSTGSFHSAATELSLSQSAVTRRLQKLEDALDVTLFERTTRSVKPTLAAKRLEPRARAILEDATQTVRAMRDESVAFAHQRNLVITVACIPTIIASTMPHTLTLFREGGTDIRVRFLDLSSNDVSEAIKGGDADFGISSLPASDPELLFEGLFEDEIVLVTPKDHPLSQAPSVSLNDIQDEPLILSARKTGNRMLIDDALARLANGPHWTYETERATTALALVAGGAGIALLPRSLVQTANGERVSWRRLEDAGLARPIGLVSRRDKAESAAISRLKQAIKTTCFQKLR